MTRSEKKTPLACSPTGTAVPHTHTRHFKMLGPLSAEEDRKKSREIKELGRS
jgi:hypothetical protein